MNRSGFYGLTSSNEDLTFHNSCSSGFHYKQWPRANIEMGLAWVQNDYKTKWIPNIWKNEEKEGESLARRWPQLTCGHLCVCRGSGGLGRAWGMPSPGPRTLLSRCGKERGGDLYTPTRTV